jgi:2'-5' RNA ligase
MMTKRLFIGLDLPARLARELAAIDPRLHGLRWLPARSLHVTLAFLGDVETTAEMSLVRALTALDAEPFALTLHGLTRFGGRGRPAIVAANVPDPPPEIFFLHTAIQTLARTSGLPTDSRPFRPHVTLARGKNCPAAPLQQFLHQHAGTDFGSFPVNGLTLFSSLLTATGAIYTPEFQREF